MVWNFKFFEVIGIYDFIFKFDFYDDFGKFYKDICIDSVWVKYWIGVGV